MGARVRYSKAGATLRATNARARASGLSGLQWRVLTAVEDLTVSWSKLEDKVYLGVLATMVYGVKESKRWQQNKVGLTLAELAGKGLIRVEAPPAGRPEKKASKPKYVIALNAAAASSIKSDENAAETGSIDAGNAAGSGVPTEKEVLTEKSKPNRAPLAAARVDTPRRTRTSKNGSGVGSIGHLELDQSTSNGQDPEAERRRQHAALAAWQRDQEVLAERPAAATP